MLSHMNTQVTLDCENHFVENVKQVTLDCRDMFFFFDCMAQVTLDCEEMMDMIRRYHLDCEEWFY